MRTLQRLKKMRYQTRSAVLAGFNASVVGQIRSLGHWHWQMQLGMASCPTRRLSSLLTHLTVRPSPMLCGSAISQLARGGCHLLVGIVQVFQPTRVTMLSGAKTHHKLATRTPGASAKTKRHRRTSGYHVFVAAAAPHQVVSSMEGFRAASQTTMGRES